MDGNGNNNSKVSTLRQHFENFDKVEQRRPSLIASTIYSSNSSQATDRLLGGDAKVSRRESQQQQRFAEVELKGKDYSKNNEYSKCSSRSGSRGDVKAFAHGVAQEYTHSRLPRSASERDLLMSVSVVSSSSEAAGRRNGIYVSNSLVFDGDIAHSNKETHQNKRRGLVILDDVDDDVVRNGPPSHRRPRQEVVEFMDDEVDDELDDVEHEDDPAEEASIPIVFDRHYEMHGDGSSIASGSTTSSHNSFNNNQSKNRAIIGEDGKSMKVSSSGVIMEANNNNNINNGPGGPRETGSSSSCSSGSGACGKVKRRNAFRHKDITSFPTASAAGDRDGSSSAILAAVAKTKVAVERVKSLDSAGSTSNSNANHSLISSTVGDSSSVKTSFNSQLNIESSKKSVSSRSFVSESSSPNPSKMKQCNSNNISCSDGSIALGRVNEAAKLKDNAMKGGPSPHELSSNSNGSKSSQAQRAASLCVRTTGSGNSNSRDDCSRNNNNNNLASNISALRSQIYEQCVNMSLAKGGNGSVSGSSYQVLSHSQAPDSNLSSNNNNNGSSSQRVVNVVTPYQVTDIYNQMAHMRVNDNASIYNPKNAQSSGKGNKGKTLDEVEYAIPMIQSFSPLRYQAHQQQQQQIPSPQQQISPQKTPSPLAEIPPKVPPPPRNYPPSSMRKDQIGLPSPNKNYTFLPHRNSAPVVTSSNSSSQTSSSSSPSRGIANKTKDSKVMSKSETKPPEKPPRTFLYNQTAPATTVPQTQPQTKSMQNKQQKSIQSKQSPTRNAVAAAASNTDLYGNTKTPPSKSRTSAATTSSSSPSSSAMGLPSVSVSHAKRQHSSSSSSSTLTSGTAATIINSYRQQVSPGNGDSSKSFQQQSSSPLQMDKSNSNNNSTKSHSVSPIGNQEGLRHKSLGKHHHSHHQHQHHHHHHHPPLVRSKTESQLVVKSKSNSNRYLNRPSDITVAHLDHHRHHHHQQDLLVDATNPNVNASLNLAFTSYPSNCPPAHHQSQTNLMTTTTSQKMYEQQQQQYRSINNLLRLSNNMSYGPPSSIQQQQSSNKYPSNPGLHYASRELTWHDNGLPPVNTGNGGPSGSSYNLYSGGQSIHSNSLMYTNIDISPGLEKRQLQQGEVPSSIGINTHGVDLLQQQRQQQNALYSPLYQYSLSERSKSEWALNMGTYGSTGGSTCSVNTTTANNYFRGSGSETSGVGNNNHNHPSGAFLPTQTVRQSGQQNNQIPISGSSSLNSSDNTNQTPPHSMNRRATVAISGGSSTGTGGMDPTKGHRHHHHHHHHHPGAPHSIQHLVNQLFSASAIKDATSSTDSGIQLGSESLSSCDTPIGDSTTDTGDSDCENEGDTSNSARKVVEARKGYVRRVSSVRVQELGESLHRLIQSSKVTQNMDPLFECLLVVGLDRDPTNGIYHPYIREKFPRDAKLPEGVEQFCFPDSLEWPCHEGSTAQFYTLAITDQRGGRKYGCCFRILPEGANFCIPITYCIISSHRAIGFYREILREITACHGHSEYQRRHFLQELYKKSFPPPGSSITVSEPTIEETYLHEHVGYGLTGSPSKPVTIRRRADQRLDEGDLVTLVSTVDLSIVIKLFGSLLLERKVVLLSRALSTLSLCVEALESLLYPFSWQHTFVPILPLDMTDVIDAPAPFLIGVLRSSRAAWDKTLDDGIVVDLDADNGKVISCVGDEGTILPKRIHRKLRNALSQLVIDLADQKDSTKNVLISECFIRMFVETLGHYSNHIITKPDGTKSFERDTFVKSAESKATQNFLEWFSETSMFNEFMELKLKNSFQHGLFEQRIMEQIDNGPIVHGGGTGGTPQKKDIWVKMKGPFGTWLKETFK